MEIISDAPALVPLVAEGENLLYNQALAGLSTSVALSIGKIRFVENILFTHKGWSGPAVLQISSYWDSGQMIQIDYLPEEKNMESLWAKGQVPFNILKGWIPSRLLETWVQTQPWLTKKSQEISNKEKQLTEKYLKQGQLLPSGTLGYEKAEVMKGGVDTRELIPQTLESRKMPGTYWGGEVCDVTGWLGGYNFQWAWVSAFVTARAIYSSLKG
jgi:predicted Rossmann fold flavoprotein